MTKAELDAIRVATGRILDQPWSALDSGSRGAAIRAANTVLRLCDELQKSKIYERGFQAGLRAATDYIAGQKP